jgi:hypothetical protein
LWPALLARTAGIHGPPETTTSQKLERRAQRLLNEVDEKPATSRFALKQHIAPAASTAGVSAPPLR